MRVFRNQFEIRKHWKFEVTREPRLKFESATVNNMGIKSGIFGQPDLFDPKLTRHFLQYARRAHERISSSWHEGHGVPNF